VHHSLLQLLKTNCRISSSTVFKVRFWCRFCLWSCVQTHRQKTVTVESQTTVTKQESPVHQVCSLTRCPQEPYVHRASFTHSTFVLESIHTCQGRENSRPKRRVETSAVQSTPTHKAAHQSQYSVHHSLLQLLKKNCMISRSTVFQVRFWCRFCMLSCLNTQTQSHHGISKGALYTTSIRHALHTSLDSNMSREETLTCYKSS
jgi:hypothetical protein